MTLAQSTFRRGLWSGPIAKVALSKRIETTVGRAIFNLALPDIDSASSTTLTMDQKQLRKVVADCYRLFKDPFDTAEVVNDIKKVGFKYLDSRWSEYRRD